MSEAEKKWREKADKDCVSFVHGICDTYRMGREAYKAALRREIEKRIGINDYKAALRESIEGVRQKAFSTNGYFHNGMVASDDFIHGWMAARNEFLKLLDTVEP